MVSCMIVARRFLRYFDWISMFFILILSFTGLLFIYSSTYTPDLPYSLFFKKQLLGVCGGIGLYVLFSCIDYREFLQWAYLLYGILIGLLVFTIIKGSIGMGAQRWITLFFIRVQPSELAKLLFPLCAVAYLYTNKERFTFGFRDYLPLIGMLFISVLLIRKQPDLGTALLLLFSGLIFLWLAGLNKKIFLYCFVALLITAPLSWQFLREYQKKRVLVFLGYGEQNKERYQIEQSKIAIGSGGIFGKGFLKGTQNKFHFLPESRTDFIFSVACEETGFIGALVLLVLYILFFFWLLSIVLAINQPIIQLLGFSLVIHILLSCVINIGMVTGLLPVVGIPLPFMSYGLSNLWVICASLGILNSIAMQHVYSQQ